LSIDPELTTEIVVGERVVEEGLLLSVLFDDETTNEFGLVTNVSSDKST
jgi:hypothetical protein